MPTNKKEVSPSQQFVEIEAIENDTIKLKNGGLRKILLVSGLNFDLKSEEEQGMISFAFQNLLNSLDFSLQIFVHSRKLNIESYLSMLNQRESQEPNELLKNQIAEYREFIRTFVSQNAIMEKTFFVAVPFDPISLPTSGGIAEKLTGIFKKANKPIKESPIEEKTEQLDLRVDETVASLNQIGLRAVPLNNDELIELFYNLYNPAAIEKKDIDLKSAELNKK